MIDYSEEKTSATQIPAAEKPVNKPLKVSIPENLSEIPPNLLIQLQLLPKTDTISEKSLLRRIAAAHNADTLLDAVEEAHTNHEINENQYIMLKKYITSNQTRDKDT